MGGEPAREIFQEPRGRAIRIWLLPALAPLGAAALCGLALAAGRGAFRADPGQPAGSIVQDGAGDAIVADVAEEIPEDAIKRLTQRRLAAEIAHLVDGELDLNHGRGRSQ